MWPMAIGAGLGLLGSMGSPKTVTTTTGFDPLTERNRAGTYGAIDRAVGTAGHGPVPPPNIPAWVPAGLRAKIMEKWNADPRNQAQAGQAGSVQGLDPNTQKALDLFGGYADAGARGAAAFSGGDNSAFTNPYQSQVIDQIKSQFGLLNDQAQLAVNDRFTKSGAFGGSRQGVASGQATADVANNLGNQIAGFQYQGFNDAMGRALQSANLGMGAGQQMASLGPYAQIMNDPNLREAYLRQQFSQGMPVGTTSTGANPNYQSPIQGLLGGAMTGYGMRGAFGGGGMPQGAMVNQTYGMPRVG